MCVFLTSLFAAGGRGRQNCLPPERPRMRRLPEVPHFSFLWSSPLARARSRCQLWDFCALGCQQDSGGIRSLSFIPTKPGRFLDVGLAEERLPPLKPLCPVSLAVDLPLTALSSPLFISRWQPAGVRAVRRLTGSLKRRCTTPTTLHWNFHRFNW